MKAKTLFTLLTLAVVSHASAQKKADLDKYSFTATYRDLPRMGLDTSFKTFSIQTVLTRNSSYMMKDEQPDERIYITGWKKLPSHAHIMVDVRMEDIQIEKSDVKERIQILKNKEGKEIGQQSFYSTEIIYSFASMMRVNDFRGKEIMQRVLTSRNSPKVYRTKEFNSRAEALTAFVSNVYAVTSLITSNEINRSMNEVNDLLNANLGYGTRTVNDYLWILDTKKHPEYKAHKQAFISFKQAMFQMRADKPLDEVKEMLKPSIAYFERVISKYYTESKADRKMRYASYYNLSKIYYYLDMPNEALFEAGQLMINDYDEKDGRGLEAAANDLKYLLELNKTDTRHFAVYEEMYSSEPTPSAHSGVHPSQGKDWQAYVNQY
jgi:hypothetical protein